MCQLSMEKLDYGGILTFCPGIFLYIYVYIYMYICMYVYIYILC